MTDIRNTGKEYGLFKNMVTKKGGRRVSNPIKPYEHEYIPPKWDKPDLKLPMEFVKLEYTGYFVFVKKLEFNTRNKPMSGDIVADITEINKKNIVEVSEAIDPVETNIDKLSDRTYDESYRQLQDLAHEVSPVRDSQGLSDLRNMTKKQLVTFIIEKRKLMCKFTTSSNNMPNKYELISICLHGYTDTSDKVKYQYNTKKWADRFYKKIDCEKLLKSKGCKIRHEWKAADLFNEIWKRGWLQRDPWLEEVPVKYKKGKLDVIMKHYKKKGTIRK